MAIAKSIVIFYYPYGGIVSTKKLWLRFPYTKKEREREKKEGRERKILSSGKFRIYYSTGTWYT